uniref:E3 binding domain-containing protein n=1 Tax=Cryptosporangium minutisporangium TaxID=113569 RepID=UPI0036708CC5
REESVDLTTLEGSGPGGRITAADVGAAAGTAPEPEQAESTASSGTEAGAGATETAASATSSTGGAATTGTSQAPQSVESADRDRTLAAPATRRIAEEEGVDIDAVPASEQRDGEPFVTPEAVREYAQAQQQAQEADRQAVEAGEPVGQKSADFEPGERERREPFRGVRKTIADAMVESKNSAPHVTHHDEVDVTEL